MKCIRFRNTSPRNHKTFSARDLPWTFSAFCHSGNFLNEEFASRSFHFPVKGLNFGFGICFDFRNSGFVLADPPLDSDQAHFGFCANNKFYGSPAQAEEAKRWGARANPLYIPMAILVPFVPGYFGREIKDFLDEGYY